MYENKQLKEFTIRGGWPDRIVNGIAIEDKTCGDRMRQNQRLCHEWIHRVTGVYPLIEYTDYNGTVRVFKSYIDFENWSHRYKGDFKKSLKLKDIEALKKEGLIKT